MQRKIIAHAAIATHMERLIFLPFFMVCKRSFFAARLSKRTDPFFMMYSMFRLCMI